MPPPDQVWTPAGTRPENIPTAIEIMIAINASGSGIEVGMNLSNNKLKGYENERPISPPTRQISEDSSKNWRSIVRLFAPRTFLMPISFVRPVTLTNMIFMIPIPPTKSDNAVMKMPTPPMIPIIPSNALVRRVCRFIEKSSGWEGDSLLIFLMITMSSSSASSISFLLDTRASISGLMWVPYISSNCHRGTITTLSRANIPMKFACTLLTPITLSGMPLILIVFPIGS